MSKRKGAPLGGLPRVLPLPGRGLLGPLLARLRLFFVLRGAAACAHPASPGAIPLLFVWRAASGGPAIDAMCRRRALGGRAHVPKAIPGPHGGQPTRCHANYQTPHDGEPSCARREPSRIFLRATNSAGSMHAYFSCLSRVSRSSFSNLAKQKNCRLRQLLLAAFNSRVSLND